MSAPKKNKWLFWGISILAPVLPDFDVISFKLGISYGDLFGHRGFSHSILFAILMGALFAFVSFKYTDAFRKKYISHFIYFFSLLMSHSLLDAFTNGGLGVALFAPFDNTRYFFPYTPIEVAAISPRRFFSLKGLIVILSEILWVWLPAILIVLGIKSYQKKAGKVRKDARE